MSSLRRSFSWTFSAQIISFAVGFGSSVFLARLLSPRDFGIYGIALATTGLVSAFTNLGLNAYVVRSVEATSEERATVYTVNLLLSLALTVILFTVGAFGRWTLGDEAAGRVMQITSFAPLLTAPPFLASAMAERELRYEQLAIITIITRVLGAAALVSMAASGLGYLSLAYGALVPSVLSLGLFYIARPADFRTGLSLAGWRDVVSFGIRIISISGAAGACFRLGEIFIGRTLGLEALGLYNRANTLANMFYDNIYGTLSRVFFAKMSEDYRRTGEARSSYLRALEVITGLMWPMLGGLAVLSGPAINLVYGAKWISSAPVLSALLLDYMIVMSYGMNWELFVLKNEMNVQTRIEITRATAGLFGVCVGCLAGIRGAAIGRIVEGAGGAFLYRGHVARLAGTEKGELLSLITRNAAISLVSVSPAILLMGWYRWSARTPILAVSGAVAVGLVLWFVALLVVRHPLAQEVRRLAANLLGRWRDARA